MGLKPNCIQKYRNKHIYHWVVYVCITYNLPITIACLNTVFRGFVLGLDFDQCRLGGTFFGHDIIAICQDRFGSAQFDWRFWITTPVVVHFNTTNNRTAGNTENDKYEIRRIYEIRIIVYYFVIDFAVFRNLWFQAVGALDRQWPVTPWNKLIRNGHCCPQKICHFERNATFCSKIIKCIFVPINLCSKYYHLS